MRKYEFIRENIDDNYGIRELQERILEIIVYIDRLCTENGIKYFLMGGSALGAIRHQGFIPWDDDLDIFMDYENYNRFINLCRSSLCERFYFQEEDSNENPHFFCKVRMNGTTYFEHIDDMNDKKHHGIFVDIMCLNNVSSNYVISKAQFYAAALLKARACTRTRYHTDSMIKKMQLLLSRLIVNGVIKKILIKFVRVYNNTTTENYSHFFGRAKFANSIYPKRDFISQRYICFENVMLPVPINAENYLRIRFGDDYLIIPSDSSTNFLKYHATYWNTVTDYREFKQLEK